MRITVLAGGVGAARFLRGLKQAAPDADITVIGNTGDDITLFGLRICPDLDTVMYTLGGGINEQQGWGRPARPSASGRSWPPTARARTGSRSVTGISPPTSCAASSWPPVSRCRTSPGCCASDGSRACGCSRCPMIRVETHVVLDGQRTVHFQEWWVRMHAQARAADIVAAGAEQAVPAPGVLDAIAEADMILFPPSNRW